MNEGSQSTLEHSNFFKFEYFTIETYNLFSLQYVCCGKHGYIDYTNNFMKVPDSCYYFENNKKSFYPHDEGCISAVSKAYLSIYRMEKWAHISLICFEVSVTRTGVCKSKSKFSN